MFLLFAGGGDLHHKTACPMSRQVVKSVALRNREVPKHVILIKKYAGDGARACGDSPQQENCKIVQNRKKLTLAGELCAIQAP
jgi:hypothetical protein